MACFHIKKKEKLLSVKNNKLIRQIDCIVERNQVFRNSSIPLIASENIISPLVESAFFTDFRHRYALGLAGKRVKGNWCFPAVEDIDEIEQIGSNSAKKLFKAKEADLRPISGSNCVTAVIFAATSLGDNIFRVPDSCGGHFATEPICKRLGVKINDLQYDRDLFELDVDKSARLIEKKKPALVLFDASHILFPHKVKELREAIGYEIRISYDASQVLGLIAGKCFQQPLIEGADVMHGSTHKTLPGPQKAMMLFRKNDAFSRKLNEAVSPVLVSNTHLHDSLALTLALLECEKFGDAYASAIVSNAKKLAESLYNLGFDVFGEKRNFTETHQIWIKLKSQEEALNAFNRLEQVGITVNNIAIPFDGGFGLRLGVAEATRRGMGKQEMEEISLILSDLLLRNESCERISNKVRELSSEFDNLHFCYSNERVK